MVESYLQSNLAKEERYVVHVLFSLSIRVHVKLPANRWSLWDTKLPTDEILSILEQLHELLELKFMRSIEVLRLIVFTTQITVRRFSKP